MRRLRTYLQPYIISIYLMNIYIYMYTALIPYSSAPSALNGEWPTLSLSLFHLCLLLNKDKMVTLQREVHAKRYLYIVNPLMDQQPSDPHTTTQPRQSTPSRFRFTPFVIQYLARTINETSTQNNLKKYQSECLYVWISLSNLIYFCIKIF